MDREELEKKMQWIYGCIDRHRPTRPASVSLQVLETRSWNTRKAVVLTALAGIGMSFVAPHAPEASWPIQMGLGSFLWGLTALSALPRFLAQQTLHLQKRGVQLTHEQENKILDFAIDHPRVVEALSKWLGRNEAQEFTSRELALVEDASLWEHKTRLDAGQRVSLRKNPTPKQREQMKEHLLLLAQAIRLERTTPASAPLTAPTRRF